MFAALAAVAALGSAGCSRTAPLSPEGTKVTLARGAPPSDCVALKYVIGKGGGSFGGKWIANEDLIEYAMNDVRNQAGSVGANYVWNDPPQLGTGHGTTSTVTITGTAYRCTGPTTPTTTASSN